MTVAGICVTPKPWDKLGNFAKLEIFAGRAAADGAQLVVTPEGFLEGYLWQDDDPQEFTREQYLEVGESIDGDFVARAASLAGDLGIYLGLGFAERQGSLMYNSMALFGPGGDLISRHLKCHTADDEPFNTNEIIWPHWEMIPHHPLTAMMAAAALTVMGVSVWGIWPRQRMRPHHESASA